MKIKTQQILTIMNIVAWIIYIGLCIETGILLVPFLLRLFSSEAVAAHLYFPLNLNELYYFNKWYYINLVSLLVFICATKAYLFHQVIRISLKVNLQQPFSLFAYHIVKKISVLVLLIAILSFTANEYGNYLVAEGIELPVTNLQKYWGGGTEFLLLAAVVFIIAQVFKRGIELQQDNELTI